MLREFCAILVLKLCAILMLKSCVVPTSQTVIISFYSPYAFIDATVQSNFAALLFDALTRDMRQTGNIELDDPGTAMAVSAYGKANPARLGLMYTNKDGSMVTLDIMPPQRPTFIKTPYDPTKTYVILSLGYHSQGVAPSIVSNKLIDLVRELQYRCKTEFISCSIRARLQKTAYSK